MSSLPAQYADFGQTVASVDVDQWVLATLELWLPTYLTHVASERNLPYAIAEPVNYANVVDDDEWPDYSLPAILVATARTATGPEVMHDGSYSAEWLVAISAVVRGRAAAETRALASYTELAVRQALVQQPSLGDHASATRWLTGGQARPMSDPTGKGRYLGEGASTFGVWTDNSVQAGVGPLAPGLPTYDPPPEVGAADEATAFDFSVTTKTEGSA